MSQGSSFNLFKMLQVLLSWAAMSTADLSVLMHSNMIARHDHVHSHFHSHSHGSQAGAHVEHAVQTSSSHAQTVSHSRLEHNGFLAHSAKASTNRFSREARDEGRAAEYIAAASQMEAEMASMVEAVMRGPGPMHVMDSSYEMDISDAVHRLKGKLPAAVSSLVAQHMNKQNSGANKTATGGAFDEASLLKTLHILNDMIFKAWKDLDDNVIECKEFEEGNRGTFDQVVADQTRLGEEIANNERQRIAAQQCAQEKQMELSNIQLSFRKARDDFFKARWKNQLEMRKRQNDLEVSRVVMDISSCKEGVFNPEGGAAALLLAKHSSNISKGLIHPAKACMGHNGLELRFIDPKLQLEIAKMTPEAQKEIQSAFELAAVEGSRKGAFAFAQFAQGQRKNCRTSPNDCTGCEDVECGIVHDRLASSFGQFQDKVDELKFEMSKNWVAYQNEEESLNRQMFTIKSTAAGCYQTLAEVVSNLNGIQMEQKLKEIQRLQLNKIYYKKMSSCKAEIGDILFTSICAVSKVRLELMSESSVIKSSDIVDCDVENWKPGVCSLGCDDRCTTSNPLTTDPYACGGWQELTRQVTQAPSQYGVRCQDTRRERKCNQQKCPVDCVMSEWTGFSKCSKDCGGGVRARTRTIMRRADHGGKPCDSVGETQQCGTGSCDRDCTLADWSPWSFCSRACSGGMQDRERKVVVPVRGHGKCPKSTAPQRHEEQSCNLMACKGDEVCVAKQDLIIAIDGSGSVEENDFPTLRDFAATLIDRYQSKYYGEEAMKVGVVQFGNGKFDNDGHISSAIKVKELTSDMSAVKTSIKGLVRQKGFTNMAQALTMAQNLLLRGGRPEAQSAIMIITDGKPSFMFQTHSKVKELKDRKVKLFFAPITPKSGPTNPDVSAGDKAVELMKKWASSPWQANLVHIPGMDVLKSDPSVFTSKLVATFCPNAQSMSTNSEEEKKLEYFLLKNNGDCGERADLLGKDVDEVGDCAVLARKAKYDAFSYGKWIRRGWCYGEKLAVNQAKLQAWQENRRDPPCSEGSGWRENWFYDQYVLS